MAVPASVPQAMSSVEPTCSTEMNSLAVFRYSFYDCLPRRGDALFELTDAVLSSDGPVTTWSGFRWPSNIAVAMAHSMTVSAAATSTWTGYDGCSRYSRCHVITTVEAVTITV